MSAWGLKHRAERKLFSEPLQRTQCGYSVVRAARKTGQPCLRHHAVRGPCCSVAKLCPTLCDPMDCSLLASLSFTISWSLLRLMSFELMIPSNNLILCFPLSSIFPSIRVFHNASALHITGPNYWSFSFSISPSKEYSGLISFQIDWFDLLAVQGTLKIVSNTIVQKHQFFSAQLSLRFNSYIHMRLLEES